MSNRKVYLNENLRRKTPLVSCIAKNNAVCSNRNHETRPLVVKGKEHGHYLSNVDVPAIFREQYICSAYRPVGLSARECLQSIFHLNNETFNVWTHILALLIIVTRYAVVVFAEYSPLDDVFVLPLLCFAVGISTTFTMSVGAHIFNCMSHHARMICFFADYASISFYTFTAGMVFIFYSRPVNTEWRIFNDPSLFLSISALASFASTFIICRSLYHQSPRRAEIIALTYSTSWVFNTLSYTSCVFFYPAQLNVPSLHYFKRHCVFYAAGTVAYVVRFPERLMSGVFDVFGHSHQFMHIMCAMGVADEFIAVQMDMLARREALEGLPGPTVGNCIVFTMAVLFGNFAVVFWYSWKLLKLRAGKEFWANLSLQVLVLISIKGRYVTVNFCCITSGHCCVYRYRVFLGVCQGERRQAE